MKNNSIKAVIITAITIMILIRVVYFFQYTESSPYSNMPINDASVYWSWSERVFNTEELPQTAYYQAPLYAFFLALLRLLGGGFISVYIVQSILGIATGIILSMTASKIWGERAFAASMLVYSLCPFFIFFEHKLLPCTITLFLHAFAVLLTINIAAVGTSHLRAFSAGAIGGLACLAWPVYVPVLALHALILFFKRKETWRSALIFILTAFFFILPVTIRNYVVESDFVLISSNSGEVFYSGNNENAWGGYSPNSELSPDVERLQHDFLRNSAKEIGRDIVTSSEASSHWSGKALQWISQNPFNWAVLETKKLAFLLSGIDVPLNYSFSFERRKFPSVLNYMPLGQSALIFLFILSLPYIRFKNSDHLILLVPVLMGTAVLMIFFVSTRYKMILLCFFIPFASAAISNIGKQMRSRKKVFLLFFVIVFMVMLNFSTSSIFAQKIRDLYELSTYNLSIVYQRKGDHENALKELRSLRANRKEIYNSIAVNHMKLKDHYSAEKALRYALEIDECYPEANFNLSVILLGRGDLEEAAVHLRQGLEHDSDNILALRLLESINKKKL